MIFHYESRSSWVSISNSMLNKWKDDHTYDLFKDAINQDYFAFYASVWFRKGLSFGSDKARLLATNTLILEAFQCALYAASCSDHDGSGSFCISGLNCLLRSKDIIGGELGLLGARSGAVLFVPRQIPYRSQFETRIPDGINYCDELNGILRIKRIRSSNKLAERPFYQPAYATVLT